MSRARLSIYTIVSALPCTAFSAEDIHATLPPATPVVHVAQQSANPVAPTVVVAPSADNAPVQAVSSEAQTASAASTPLLVMEKPAKPFAPFTGKVKGRKVRLRAHPELDGHVLRELNKGDLLAVVGEKGDFFAVEPPHGIKAYVFRTFVLDNIVEGNHVNVRLEPSLEAPIIGHLNAGDQVDSEVSAENNKWLKITVPPTTRFYVAKEYIEHVGGPEFKTQFDKRKAAAEGILDKATLLTKVEMRKDFEEIDIQKISDLYHTLMREHKDDFPEYAKQAEEALSALQEAYLEKKVAFLEAKSTASTEENFSETTALGEETVAAQPQESATDKMKLWDALEQSLYLSWAQLNDDRDIQEFYEEQKLSPVVLTGIVEAYTAAVKNKPGDFLIRNDEDLPVGYVYSTQVNLQNYVGKKVSLIAAPRPNNNFAFPAYYILAVE